MFHSARDDTKIAGLQNHMMVTELDNHFAVPDQKHFVFVFVMMPRELPLKFYKLDFLTI